jgi:hypothetical protein
VGEKNLEFGVGVCTSNYWWLLEVLSVEPVVSAMRVADGRGARGTFLLWIRMYHSPTRDAFALGLRSANLKSMATPE